MVLDGRCRRGLLEASGERAQERDLFAFWLMMMKPPGGRS
jgi:hypothetical protein